MRSRRPAPPAARLARRAAAGGRAGRAGRRSPASCPPGTGSAGGRACARRSCRCRRSRCRSALWESELLPRRVPGYRPEQLDALCASGEVVWVGAGADRVARLLPRGRRGARRGRRRRRRPPVELHEALRARARASARSSGTTCSRRAAADADEALPALWDLVWAGEVDERRLGAAPRRPPPRRPASPSGARAASRARAATAATATQGRWSLTARLFAGRAGAAGARRAPARAAGDRHPRRRPGRGDPRRLRRGLRRAARARDARPLPPRLLRRGARRRPVRARRRGRAPARAARGGRGARARSVLAAADPAQPYGAALPWPKRAGRARGAGRGRLRRARSAASRCSTSSAAAARCVPLRDPDESWLRPGARGARRPRPAAGAAGASRSSASTAQPVTESEVAAAARRGRVPRRAAAGRAAAVTRACLRATRSTGPRGPAAAARRASGSRSRRRTRAPVRRSVAERLDGRRLEAVEAIGKNLVLRFEGGVVLRSHLRMSGRWRCGPRGAAAAGLPWLVLRGAELEGVLWGGPVLELHTRALAASRPRHPRLAARARARCSPGSIGADGIAPPSARRCSTRASSPGSATCGWPRRSGRRGSRPGGASPRSPAASGGARSRRRPRLMRAAVEHGREPRAQVYGRAGRPCPRCGAPIRSPRSGRREPHAPTGARPASPGPTAAGGVTGALRSRVGDRRPAA